MALIASGIVIGYCHRLSKSVASQRLAKDDVRAALAYSEESDDSLIGDHSPFVKSTRSRRYVCTFEEFCGFKT